MGVTTVQYIKKPLYVDAIRITRTNFDDVAAWCSGRIQNERSKKYIKIKAHNPINNRQTKAFVGDWVLRTERGFKIYSHQAFQDSFDKVQIEEEKKAVA